VKTVLITGASSGYGNAIAALFLQHGWNVAATMRRPDPSRLPEVPDRLRIIPMDVTDADSIASAVDAAISAFGHIDVLVNNAGIGSFSPFEVTPLRTIRDIFETNTFGLMAVTQAVIPHMRERRSGTIVNVTSSVCFAGMPLVAPYAASKFAVEGFSEALFFEMASLGIRVKLVEPGYGPGTRFTANSGDRITGLDSPHYSAYAMKVMAFAQAPSTTTTADQVADKVLDAAMDTTDRLRFPAGPDSEALAQARWAQTDEAFLSGMRARLPRSAT
jgi:NAD(P)-dependent dehydrogenase (short-subunit alcohol dehydrogenase family)